MSSLSVPQQGSTVWRRVEPQSPPPTDAILLPSAYPEVQPYPELKRLLRVQVDMQFIDLATQLRLPMAAEGLMGGCNLAATIGACTVIAGASVLFYEPSLDAVQDRSSPENPLRSGARFKRVVREYFPWQGDEPVSPGEVAALLYTHTRNPLAHRLGVGKAGADFPGLGGNTVMLSKGALPPTWVADVMRGDHDPPPILGALLTRDDATYVIDVATLVWAVCRMLRSLLADESQAPRAEAVARQLRGTV